jgi:hypothetical protein
MDTTTMALIAIAGVAVLGGLVLWASSGRKQAVYR